MQNNIMIQNVEESICLFSVSFKASIFFSVSFKASVAKDIHTETSQSQSVAFTLTILGLLTRPPKYEE